MALAIKYDPVAFAQIDCAEPNRLAEVVGDCTVRVYDAGALGQPTPLKPVARYVVVAAGASVMLRVVAPVDQR